MKNFRFGTAMFLVLMSQNFIYAQESLVGIGSYVFNPLVLSPSFAGKNTGTLAILQDYRFMGNLGALPGDQNKNIVSFDYGLVDLNLGLGLAISNSGFGPSQASIVHLSTAYHLKVGRGETFSFGMRHNMGNVSRDLEGLNRITLADPTVSFNTFSEFDYDLDLSGIYSSRKTYVGATIFNVIPEKDLVQDISTLAFTLFMGSEYQYSRNIRLAYSAAFVAPTNAGNILYLYGQYFITPQFKVGLHKHAQNWGFNTVFAQKGFNVFYKYSFLAGPINLMSSHTVGLSFDFINEQTKIETPIFFLN